jgi:hypothetical protein
MSFSLRELRFRYRATSVVLTVPRAGAHRDAACICYLEYPRTFDGAYDRATTVPRACLNRLCEIFPADDFAEPGVGTECEVSAELVVRCARPTAARRIRNSKR